VGRRCPRRNGALNLRIFVDAAIDRRHAQRQMSSVGAHILFDLHDQLARRRHDNTRIPAAPRADHPASIPRIGSVNRRRLARPRLPRCRSHHALPESTGSPLPERGWFRITSFVNGPSNIRINSKSSKWIALYYGATRTNSTSNPTKAHPVS